MAIKLRRNASAPGARTAPTRGSRRPGSPSSLRGTARRWRAPTAREAMAPPTTAAPHEAATRPPADRPPPGGWSADPSQPTAPQGCRGPQSDRPSRGSEEECCMLKAICIPGKRQRKKRRC
ncbi:uncharacterized protein LOC110403869 [Numida meleagris]|uniref:uncharacterized protein LOC110403869 n=1 Tax=Numida meleagris TaxID=8996 RepID=UPI000B3DF8B5|nr:uncharacterized protein LOC110403869 [Numida meleagris]